MLPTIGGASFAIDALHFVQHILCNDMQFGEVNFDHILRSAKGDPKRSPHCRRLIAIIALKIHHVPEESLIYSEVPATRGWFAKIDRAARLILCFLAKLRLAKTTRRHFRDESIRASPIGNVHPRP